MRGTAPTRRAAFALLTALVGIAAAPADAQEAGSRQTREFVQAAASSDQFEIVSAQTALTQSRNPDVRAMAEKTMEDHRQTSQSLRDAALRSGLKPPAMAMTGDQAQWIGALQSAGADEFDLLYLKQQRLAHRSALVVEQMYAKFGDDANLRQSATAAVPIISSHLDMASRASAKLGSP